MAISDWWAHVMTSLMLATPDWWIHSCCFPEVSRTLLLPASLLLASKVRSCPFSLKMEAIWSKNSKKHPKKRIFLINTPGIPVPFSWESQAVSRDRDREISKSHDFKYCEQDFPELPSQTQLNLQGGLSPADATSLVSFPFTIP